MKTVRKRHNAADDSYSHTDAVTKKRSGKFRLFTCLNVLNSD